MANIFLGTEVEPSAFEIALQGLFLDGLQKRVNETGDFSESIRHTLGFKTNQADGSLIPLTEQERFDSLDPIEQDTFNTFKTQLGEINKAFSGEKTEFQKQRSADRFDTIRETLARRGHVVEGTDLDTGVGFSTPAIQSLANASRNERLQVSAEQEDRKRRGLTGLLNTANTFNKLKTNRAGLLAEAPNRFDIGGGSGLLRSAGTNARQLAQQTQDNISGFGGLLGDIAKTGIINKFFPSDKKFKKDVKPLENVLENVLALRGVSYKWKVDEYPDKGFTEDGQIGVIAQELEEVYPEFVHTDDEGFKSVSYQFLTAVLIEGVKEIKKENDQLEDRLSILESVVGDRLSV